MTVHTLSEITSMSTGDYMAYYQSLENDSRKSGIHYLRYHYLDINNFRGDVLKSLKILFSVYRDLISNVRKVDVVAGLTPDAISDTDILASITWEREDCNTEYTYVDTQQAIFDLFTIYFSTNYIPEDINTDFSLNDNVIATLGLDVIRNPIEAPEIELICNPPTGNEFNDRFKGALWYNKVSKSVITIIGVGGIGSFVSFLLSRASPKTIYIMDDDEVEGVNLSGQFYDKNSIRKKKVDAASKIIEDFSGYNSVVAIPRKFTEECGLSKITICGLDNMESRKVVFNSWLKLVDSMPENERNEFIFIDGRLAVESLQVFCITGDNSEAIYKYRDQYLFSDSEADATSCSYKQTTFMASMIGSIITNLFINFITNSIVPSLRDLPFYTSYDADTMIFKTND